MQFKQTVAKIASAALVIGSFVVGNIALAVPQSLINAQENLNTASGGVGAGGTSDLPTLVNRIVNVALGFLGMLLFLYFFYGGFLWMTAGGDSKKVDTAKTMLKNATIGLVIILSSWAISSFVLGELITATTT